MKNLDFDASQEAMELREPEHVRCCGDHRHLGLHGGPTLLQGLLHPANLLGRIEWHTHGRGAEFWKSFSMSLRIFKRF